MSKFKRFFWPLIICSLMLFIGAVVYYQLKSSSKKPEQINQEISQKEYLLKELEFVSRLWEEGEDSREWLIVREKCLKKLKITENFDERLLRCNPLILECIGTFSKNLPVKFLSVNPENNGMYRYLSKANSAVTDLRNSGYWFRVAHPQNESMYLDVVLEDKCRENFLEERSYAYGEEFLEGESEDYRFDNFGRKIYVDNHLVTNFDINQWIDFGNKTDILGLEKKSGNDLFRPAVFLTQDQMEKYCAFKEKQLMFAHIFDAATFLPMNLQEKNPTVLHRSPYYWTKNTKNISFSCKNIFTKECLRNSPFILNQTDPTWAGLYDSMGGVMEYFKNPIEPDSNLKASSFYFDKNSSWHKLGFRAYWDGKDFDYKNFDFRGLSPFIADEKIQIGFRCMREI